MSQHTLPSRTSKLPQGRSSPWGMTMMFRWWLIRLLHLSLSSLTGIGEVVLLPLDVLKILRQTNPEAFRNRSFLSVVKDEGFALYRGWGWTMARNAPGSFAVRPLPPHRRARVQSPLPLGPC